MLEIHKHTIITVLEWNSTPLTSLPLKSISWGNFSSVRTPEYLERQRTTMFLVYRENQITYSFFSMTEIPIRCFPPCPTAHPSPNAHIHPHSTPGPSVLTVLLTGSYASNSSACFSLLSCCSSPPFLSEHAPGTRAGTCLLIAIEPIPVMEEPSLP